MTKVSKPGDEPIDVRSAVAAEAGVSRGTVQNYMEIAKHGPPELLEQVKRGELKIGKAHNYLHKEMVKRFNLADKEIAYLEKNLPIEGDDEANKILYAKLVELEQLMYQVRRRNYLASRQNNTAPHTPGV